MSEPDDRSSGPRALTPLGSPHSARHGQHRRSVLTGVGSAGVAALLSGCQTDDEGTLSELSTPAAPPADPGATASADAGMTTDALTDETSEALATVADIPVGGGKIFADQGVVVTQATAGRIRGFSAKCTHQGCTVTSVENARIVCGCHNSTFDIVDGSAKTGPANRPLPEVAVRVSGDNIYLA